MNNIPKSSALILRAVTALCFGVGVMSALDSLTFQVGPGDDLAGGMGKVESFGYNIIIPKDQWYAKDLVAAALEDPKVLISTPSAFFSCDSNPGAFKLWIYRMSVPIPNTRMSSAFSGALVPCSTGGSGETPTFKVTIVHADFDVDSDNNSEYTQKEPQRTDAEDAIEEKDPGVIIPCNRGHLESKGDLSQPDDNEKFGINTDDTDLVRSILEIKGRSGKVTFVYPANISLWKDAATRIDSGKPIDVSVGTFTYWIEGIEPGRGDIDLAFTGDWQNKVTDKVRFSVFDVEITKIVPSYYADSESWYPVRFEVKGPEDLRVAKFDSVTSVFYFNDKEEKFRYDIVKASPLKPANGTAFNYIGVIDQAKFDGLLTSGEVKKDIGTVMLENIRGKFKSGQVLRISAAKKPERKVTFGDKTIEVVEIGTGDVKDSAIQKIRIDKNQTRQNQLAKKADDSFSTLGRSYNRRDRTIVVFPLGMDSAVAESISAPPSGFWGQQTALADDWDVLPGGFNDYIYEAASKDEQRGIYWLVYHNRLEIGAPGNPFGHPVVGQAEYGGVTWRAFIGGSTTAEIHSQSVYYETYLDVVGAGLSALGGVSPKGISEKLNAVGDALQFASKVIASLRDADEDVGLIFVTAFIGGKPVVPDAIGEKIVKELPIVEISKNESVNKQIKLSDRDGYAVDNAYTLFVSSTAFVRARTRPPTLFPTLVSIDAELRVNLGDSAVALNWDKVPTTIATSTYVDDK